MNGLVIKYGNRVMPVPTVYARRKAIFTLQWALLLTCLGLGFAVKDVHAQVVDWAKGIYGDAAANARHMTIDHANNLYITGNFVGTLNFGTTTLTNSEAGNIFIAKYDAQGNLLRAQQIGGAGGQDVHWITVDGNENVYITGYFQNSITLGTTTFTAQDGYYNIFMAKYDPQGTLIWAKRLVSIIDNAYGDAISVDEAGNVYLLGAWGGTVDLGGQIIEGEPNLDAFLAKYDANGNFLWVQEIKGFGGARGAGIVHDSNNVYIAGSFTGVATIASTPLIPNGAPSRKADPFLAAFDTNGTLLWVRNDGSSSNDSGSGLAVDSQGNLYMTGYFVGTAQFGAITVRSYRLRDGFIAKYANSGEPLWVRSFGGPSSRSHQVTVDDEDNVYFTGTMAPGEGTIGTAEVSGNGFIVARYESDGDFVWVRQATSPDMVYVRGLVADDNGYVYTTGGYNTSTTLWPFTLTGTGQYRDLFVARWTPGPAIDPIFADGFESGDFSAWSDYSSDLGDLSVSPSAALVSGQGLTLVLDDNTPIGMRDEKPNSETRYRARFYLDPNSISMAQDENHVIFFGYSGSDLTRPVLRLELRYRDGQYQVRSGIFDDATTWRVSLWLPISDEAHLIELDWQAAVGDGTNDGRVAVIIDEVVRSIVGLVDNDTRRIDTIRLGAIAGIDDNTRGTYYLDAFESRRITYIGAAPAIAVAMAAPAIVSDIDALAAWEEVDESDRAEAALMQEVLEYAAQVERETGQEQTTPLFLPFVNNR